MQMLLLFGPCRSKDHGEDDGRGVCFARVVVPRISLDKDNTMSVVDDMAAAG
jgi:hypothetical protein